MEADISHQFIHETLTNKQESIDEMIKFYEDNHYHYPSYMIRGFFCACFHGHLNIVNSFVNKTSRNLGFDILGAGILYSRYNKHDDIVNFLVEKYENCLPNYRNLSMVVQKQEFSLADALIAHNSFDVNDGFRIACVSNDLMFAQHMVKHGASPVAFVQSAFEFGSVDIVRYMIQCGACLPHYFYKNFGYCNRYGANSKNIHRNVEIAMLLFQQKMERTIRFTNDEIIYHLLERGIGSERFQPSLSVELVKHNIKTFRQTIRQQNTVLLLDLLNIICQYSLY